ncbi:LysM peptidoglycan-binding domain-containing protein [Candidatus Halobeggiatoa sp. HSG11]|nr:LysM peptidoglycan-binding domain-containing protein [Candidatus Halobeggiatoa sp. HSG11]
MKVKLIMVGLLIWGLQAFAATEECSYQVAKVAKNDSLSMRLGPGVKYQKVGVIPHNGIEIQITGPEIKIGETAWNPVKYKGINGWVNRGYLKKNCPSYHNVIFGETLFYIAQKYGYDVKNITKWNNLQPPYALAAGQKLQLFPRNCQYRVINVRNDDMLWIRLEASEKSQRIGAVPFNGNEIMITGPEKVVKNTHWIPVKYKECITGWVNRSFLEEDC